MRKLLVIIMIGLSFILRAQPENLITHVHIKKNYLKVYMNEKLKRFVRQSFFVEYENDIDLHKLPYSIVTMPFICNVIPIIWITGQNYSITEMDEDLFYSLEKVRTVLRRLYPSTGWNGNLIPKKLVKNTPLESLKDPEKHIALLFSGGLDSVSSSFNHINKKQLLITAWGQSDVPLDHHAVWNERKRACKKFAENYGHTNAFLRSNFSSSLKWVTLSLVSKEIEEWRIDANEGLSLFGLCAPILYLKGYSVLRMASSYCWSYPYPSSANPLIDDHITFAGNIRLKHDQFETNRLEKIQVIANVAKKNNIQIPLIKVCNNKRPDNCCSDCGKCVHTMLAILALNEDLMAFGFNTTREKALEIAKQSLTKKQHYNAIWHILCVQDRLKNDAAKGQKIALDLEWLLNVELTECLNAHYRYKKKVRWQDFKDIAPHDIEIPNVNPLDFEIEKVLKSLMSDKTYVNYVSTKSSSMLKNKDLLLEKNDTAHIK